MDLFIPTVFSEFNMSLLTERLEGPKREDYSAALMAIRREGVNASRRQS